jgi:hypothetical protein
LEVVVVLVVVAVVVEVVVAVVVEEQSSLFATGFCASSEAELLLQYVMANDAPAASVAWVDVGVSFTCVVLCEYVTPSAQSTFTPDGRSNSTVQLFTVVVAPFFSVMKPQ